MTVQMTATSQPPVVTIKLASTSDELLQCYRAARRRVHGRAALPVLARSSTATTTPPRTSIMYVDGEPAGIHAPALVPVVRKFERCVVLRRYRGARHPIRFIAWCKEFAATQGLHQGLSASAEAACADHGEGGLPPVDDRVFNFSDHEYCAVYCDLACRTKAPSMLDDLPMVAQPAGRPPGYARASSRSRWRAALPIRTRRTWTDVAPIEEKQT